MIGDVGETLRDEVRVHVFTQAAETGHVPQAPAIADRLGRPVDEVQQALRELAAAKVLILAPNDGDIWAANPFCAVPSGFRVTAGARRYWGICIWDALGIVAAIGARDAVIDANCGDCGEPVRLRFENGDLAEAPDIIHFAVPARGWWRNIGFA